MTCQCRYCGYTICYSLDDVGHDARCSRCGQTIRLPGKLASIATLKRIRQKDIKGIGMELGGFALMFFLFPWGFVAGGTLLYFGWRKSTALVCSNCGNMVKDKDVSNCNKCRSSFSMD
jgi:predicted Zn-ribbon and HTH transcriptional regulator